MHCLYCDRPLALLKRLTGEGAFCSKDHRRLYQSEQNQLAIERLREASTVHPRRNGKVEEVPAARIEPARPPKKDERQPVPANFVDAYPRVAKSNSGSTQVIGDPRFLDFTPAWGLNGAPSTQPNNALFQSEPFEPRPFDGAIRFSNYPSLRAPVRLAETLSLATFGAAARSGPPAADFCAAQPPSPAGLREAPRGLPVSPRFRIEALGTCLAIAGGGDSRLDPARFLAEPSAAPRPASDRIRGPEADARWKALSPALPEQPAGRIVAVLGSLLQPPVRVAAPGQLPAIFEIPLRPVSFPQAALLMASLANRLHRTDRIGFTPP